MLLLCLNVSLHKYLSSSLTSDRLLALCVLHWIHKLLEKSSHLVVRHEKHFLKNVKTSGTSSLFTDQQT